MSIHFRSMRYFTRPSLIMADIERREAGIPDRHAHPPFKKLHRGHRYVVVCAYPFLNGFGDGIPQVRVVIQWAEGGMQWTADVLMTRYRQLPKMSVENPHLYNME